MQKQPIPPARSHKQKIEHCGWLRKLGGRYRNLRSRWFELKGDQLYYFRDNNEPKTPIASIPLPGNEVVRHAPDPGEPGKFKFEIVSGKDKEGRPVSSTHDTFVLIASSQQEMDEWIRAINRIIYAPVGGGMFGRSLAETVKFETRRGGGYVPLVVHKCVDFIKAHGLSEEGLFRLPGQAKDVADLKDAFNRGKIPELGCNKSELHSVASVLKSYLRELPEPLIPYDYFEVFLTAARCYEMCEEDGIIAIQKQLTTLPKPNYILLRYLCRFLYEVQEHSKENKMGVRNLATVFGPNILRSGSEDPQVMMESANLVTELISILIRKQELFFPQTDDEDLQALRLQQPGGDLNLIDFAESPRMPRPQPVTPSDSEHDEEIAEDPRSQIQELENELELQQQQNKDLQSKIEQERKVREMLVLRLTDEQRARGDLNLIDSAESPRMPRPQPVTPSDSEHDEEIAEDPRSQIQELENELELQQQQIKDLKQQLQQQQSKIEQERKVREMLVLRLTDEQRARESAEDRLEKLQAAMEDFCAKYGSWEPTQR